MTNLQLRALSGAAYVAVLLGALWWGYDSTALLFFLLGMLGLNEYARLVEGLDGISLPRLPLLGLGAVGLGLGGYAFRGMNYLLVMNELFMLYLQLVFLASVVYVVFSRRERSFVQVGVSLLGLLYVLLPCVLAMSLARFNTGYLAMVLVGVWSNDVGAYLVGSAVGRHPMFPSVSPKKSWEGFAGGVVATVLVSVLLGPWLARRYELHSWALFGVLVSLAAVVGDLFESRLKRTVGVKDSGSFLPGHGGVLDRVDAMLLALPVAYILVLSKLLL
ncbi:MAG: hypothetical protein CSA07_03780 [Bacteroidia bacterium]|nr:MAG: hypothetical protein CSA07_03780 [Bacteroidia bacterium]